MVYLNKNEYQLVMKNRKSIHVSGPNPSKHLSLSITKRIIEEAKQIDLIPNNMETKSKESLIKEFSDIFYTYCVIFHSSIRDLIKYWK